MAAAKHYFKGEYKLCVELSDMLVLTMQKKH